MTSPRTELIIDWITAGGKEKKENFDYNNFRHLIIAYYKTNREQEKDR